MKIFNRILGISALVFCLVSCSDDKILLPEGPVDLTSPDGIYVLNSGKMGNNDAQLVYYDMSEQEVTAKVFSTANGRNLGDTGNSMIIYGGKIYIALTGSAIVFVTDLKGNLLKEITVQGEGANLSPRQMAKGADKVYVSYMEGYVGAIDTSNFEVNTVKVGPFPEGIAYVNKKVFVANSDGYNYPNYGTTVSVIDPASLSVVKTIEVASNPQSLHVSTTNELYLISWGNYSDIPSSLQKINTSNYQVTTIEDVRATNMAVGRDGMAYIIVSEYDEEWNNKISYYLFDTVKDRIVGEFISSEEVPNGYSIFANDVTGDVYIGTSDYINNGDVYIVSEEGKVKGHFDTKGLNPIAISALK